MALQRGDGWKVKWAATKLLSLPAQRLIDQQSAGVDPQFINIRNLYDPQIPLNDHSVSCDATKLCNWRHAEKGPQKLPKTFNLHKHL